MNKIFKIIGIVLVVAGACIGAFSGIAVADYIGIAVAMIGAAMAIVSTFRQAEKKDWKTIASIACVAVGAFLCGLAGLSDTVVTQIITAVIGVVSLIVGIIIPIVAKSKGKTEEKIE